MATIAIGDIHGCRISLACFLDEMKPRAEDRLIFLGDYIDRGPSSRGVVDLLIELQKAVPCVFLRGNHEAMILAARLDRTQADLWQSYGGFETVHSYGGRFGPEWTQSIPEAHWKFFEGTINWFQTDQHIFVHGGLDPEFEMEQQKEAILLWERFEKIRPHKSGKKIICGHTPDRSGAIRNLGFAVCIDTGPAVGGWLTGLNPESGEMWQANEYGSVRVGRLGTL